MNRVIEQFFLPLFVIISLLYAFQSLGVQLQQSVQLKKVYHHRSGQPKHLELGSLVFYFASESQPLVNVLQTNRIDSTHEERVFFFPYADVSGRECKHMINRINKEDQAYAIFIESVDQPMKGIRVSIRYDMNDIALAYEFFESIGMQKGIVFRMYNKSILGQLRGQVHRPILRTTWSDYKPHIVIDCGHGGKDYGAIGMGGVQEKNVCLSVGTALALLLRTQGCQVMLTRKADDMVLLDERTAYANACNADLLISIHANYAANRKVTGLETFCMMPGLFIPQFCTLTQAQKKIVYHVNNQVAVHSEKLARSVQQHVCATINIVDRTVKHAVAQVLLGSRMPAVLVEIGFLSNKREAKLLVTPTYQYKLAQGICKGIMAYLA